MAARVRRRRAVPRRRTSRRTRMVRRRPVKGRRLMTVTPATAPYGYALGSLAARTKRPRYQIGKTRQPNFGMQEGVRVKRTKAGTTVKGVEELSRYTAKFGVSKYRLNTRNLLVRAIPERILRFHGVNPQDMQPAVNADGGFYNLSNEITATSSTGVVPMYVLSLNGTVQNSSHEFPLRRVGVMSSGRVYFTTVTGKLPSSTVNTTSDNSALFVETSTSGADAADEFRHIVNEWQQIRLAMHGAKNSITTFYVELIQCNKDYAAVEDDSDLFTMSGSHGDRYRDEVYGYWQNKIKKLVSSGIVDNNVSVQRGVYSPFITLRTWKFDVKPVRTDEADQTPNVIHANLFLNDGRMCDYQWVRNGNAYDAGNNNTANGMDDALINPNWISRMADASDGISLNPAPKARRYLIISAGNYRNGITPVDDIETIGENDVHKYIPSFDLIYRKKERMAFKE